MIQTGIYIHVPFCDGKCHYCSFYSVKACEKKIEAYTERMCSLVSDYGKRLSSRIVDSIYFGGGTPNLLGTERIVRILGAVRKNFRVQDAEITMEVNPTKGKDIDFSALRKSGINRLSIGLQSANDRELKILGRRHSVKDVETTICRAKNGGFSNISLDLMLGIPEQTRESLKKSIEFCEKQDVQHISSYMLSIEEGCGYYKNRAKLNLPGEEQTREFYLQACEELEKSGFQQYEISNFSKKGKESRHNLKYWGIEEYLGLGPSAHSFLGGKRFFYPSSISSFLRGEPCEISDETPNLQEEYVMLQLRLRCGLLQENFKEKFGCEIPRRYYENAKPFEALGLLSCSEKGIAFSREGFLLSSELLARIL